MVLEEPGEADHRPQRRQPGLDARRAAGQADEVDDAVVVEGQFQVAVGHEGDDVAAGAEEADGGEQ